MKYQFKLAILIANIIAVTTHAEPASLTRFEYRAGEPKGSYVAQKAGSASPEDGWKFQEGVHSYPNTRAVSFSMKNEKEWWSIEIEMPEKGKLEVGTYSATRFPFNKMGTAGFGWSGNGRGNNTSTSFFRILEVGYSEDGKTITRIALDFMQGEENDGQQIDLDKNRWSYGSFRYNSTVPIQLPDPKKIVELFKKEK